MSHCNFLVLSWQNDFLLTPERIPRLSVQQTEGKEICFLVSCKEQSGFFTPLFSKED